MRGGYFLHIAPIPRVACPRMYERRLGIFTGTVPTQMQQSLRLKLYHRSVRRSVALVLQRTTILGVHHSVPMCVRSSEAMRKDTELLPACLV